MTYPSSKILVIGGGSEWHSCRTLSINLKKAYELAFGSRVVFKSYLEISGLRQQGNFCFEDFGKIVLLDHNPHPAEILKKILCLPTGSGFTGSIDIQLYGDFTMHAAEWMEVESLLRDHPIQFICASERTTAFVSQFVKNAKRLVRTIPRPVDTLEFDFDPKERRRIRQKYGIGPRDRLIVYTGRLSLHKNIDFMLNQFARLRRSSKVNTHLFVVGTFDDIGADAFGLPSLLGWNFKKVERTLSNMEPELKRQIHFIEPSRQSEVRQFLSAADLFWSFSLYHDEDFGLAPAEAMASGLPCVLSNWGGYSSFIKAHDAIELIDVSYSDGDFVFNVDQLQRRTRHHLETALLTNERRQLAKKFTDRFSIPAIAEALKELNQEQVSIFRGFNVNLDKLLTYPKSALWPIRGSKFERIYSSLWRENLYP